MKDYESLGIGKVIESLRRGKQMTQEDLAEKAGLEPNTISRIERDDVVPSYWSILNIGRALNLTPMEFGEKIEKHSKILDYYRQQNKRELKIRYGDNRYIVFLLKINVKLFTLIKRKDKEVITYVMIFHQQLLIQRAFEFFVRAR